MGALTPLFLLFTSRKLHKIVMFSQASVCSRGGGGRWGAGVGDMHYGIFHMVGLPPSPGHIHPPTPTYRPTPLHMSMPAPLLVTSGGEHWRPVQNCSPPSQQYQHLVMVNEAEGTHPTRILSC